MALGSGARWWVIRILLCFLPDEKYWASYLTAQHSVCEQFLPPGTQLRIPRVPVCKSLSTVPGNEVRARQQAASITVAVKDPVFVSAFLPDQINPYLPAFSFPFFQKSPPWGIKTTFLPPVLALDAPSY